MPYLESKVYFDGSHYIAIPHTTRFVKKKYYKPPPEKIKLKGVDDTVNKTVPSFSPYTDLVPITLDVDIFPDDDYVPPPKVESKPEPVKETPVADMTYKELFNEVYSKYIELPKRQRKAAIVKDMLPYFKNEAQCRNYVHQQIGRKIRNLVCRRTRMMRKAALIDFNYFVTFTYDNAKHDENSFKKNKKRVFATFVFARGGNIWVFGNGRPKLQDCIFTVCFISQTEQWWGI